MKSQVQVRIFYLTLNEMQVYCHEEIFYCVSRCSAVKIKWMIDGLPICVCVVFAQQAGQNKI